MFGKDKNCIYENKILEKGFMEADRQLNIWGTTVFLTAHLFEEGAMYNRKRLSDG